MTKPVLQVSCKWQLLYTVTEVAGKEDKETEKELRYNN